MVLFIMLAEVIKSLNESLDLKPSTLNPKLSTLAPQTSNPHPPPTLNPEPLNPRPINYKRYTLKPELFTQNPRP